MMVNIIIGAIILVMQHTLVNFVKRSKKENAQHVL